jgi:integrase
MSSIEEATKAASCSLLPTKSQERYKQSYENLIEWYATKDTEEISENVLLENFLEKSNVLKSPASLWSKYSMLKLTISVNNNLDISKFERLKMFIKRKNDGYQARKSQVFSRDAVVKFLLDAPNEIFLMKKVLANFGVGGACRCDELYNLKIQDVNHKDNIIVVQIISTKNNVPRRFVITNGEDQKDWATLVNRYYATST